MSIEYDPGKNSLNQRQHGVPLTLAETFEWDTAQIEEDTRFDYPEQRFEATGLIGTCVYILIYCYSGDAVRAISLRKAGKQEAKDYASYYAQSAFTPDSHPQR